MTAIELVIDPRERRVGNGTVRRLLPFRRRRMVGPFIFLDRPGTDEPEPGGRVDIAAHPHIGLATLTYLFDGEIVHRDSVGSVQTIRPGAVNWMTAGSGVTHTERSPLDHPPGAPAFDGLQMWVALPTEAEDTDPSFDHRPADAIPGERRGDVHIRVPAGTAFGMTSPVPVSSPLVLAEIELGGEASITLDREMPERALLVLDGDMTVGGEPVKAGSLAVLDPDQTPRLEGRGRAMLLGGEPVGRRHIWWNFVHSDPDVIEDAKHRWRNQHFPEVPGDHEGWVPLPE